jgi:hypothetical protein
MLKAALRIPLILLAGLLPHAAPIVIHGRER